MTDLLVRIQKPRGLPEVAKRKMWWFLKMLSAYGKAGYSYSDPDRDWFSVFCGDENDLGLDTDTFNIAETFGFCHTTHDSDTDVSWTTITDKGIESMNVNAAFFGYEER